MRFIATASLLLVLGLALPALAEEAAAPESSTEVLTANADRVLTRVNAALDKVGDWVEATEGFAKEQTPLLIKEIVLFEVARNGFHLFMALCGIAWGCFAWRYSHRNAVARLAAAEFHEKHLKQLRRDAGKSQGDTCDVVFTFSHYAVPVTGVITTVCGFLGFLLTVTDFVKPLVAPRLFLVEYFQHLVR